MTELLSKEKLPNRIKRKARKNYKLWKQNPYHPSSEFKEVHPSKPIYSVCTSLIAMLVRSLCPITPTDRVLKRR